MDILPEGKTCVVGLSLFSLALTREGSRLSVNGYARKEGEQPIRFWGAGYQPIDIDKALSSLIASWKDIAGPFSEDEIASGSFDLSSLLATPLPPVILTRNGVFIRIDDGHAQMDLEHHSVVAVEVLLRIGEILAGMSQDANLKRAWSDCRQKTDLLPFETNVDFEFRLEGEMEEETAWHAGKFGQSPEGYSLAAQWLTARQRLYGILKEGEDVPSESWSPTVLPEGLPSREIVEAMVRRAARAEGIDANEFARQAVHGRNLDARQINVYGRWYPIATSPTP